MIQRALTLVGKQHMEWETYELPRLKDHEVLIQTIATSISIGAELPQFDASDLTDLVPTYPRKVGYESFGRVLKIGRKVSNLNIGDKVLAFYGQKDLAVVKESDAFFVPPHIDYKTALLAILSCDAAKGVRKLNPTIDHKVIVSGMGTMGLLTLFYLKVFYEVKHVDVIEPNPSRQEMAKKMDANHVYTVQEAPDDCYDMAFECSATNHSFAFLQESVRAEGKICILSDGNKEEFKLLPIFFEKELSLVGSSDGWDYKKHFEWYFSIAELMPHLTDIFEYEIRNDEIIKVFHQLSRNEIHPLKIAVLYQQN